MAAPATLWTSTRTSGSIAHAVAGASGLPVEVRFISLRAGDHKAPAYLAINPKGEVPALQLADGTVITEIPAICLWLAEAAPESGLLPRDPTGRAKAAEWLAWCHFRMANAFTTAFTAARVFPEDEAAAAKLRAACVDRARAALEFADARLAGTGTLLGTAQVTAPDIFLASLWRFGGFLGIDIAAFANLAALAAKVDAHPGVAAAMAKEAAQG